MTDQEIEVLVKKIADSGAKGKAMVESAQKKEKQHNVLSAVGYVMGSMALFTVACVTLPTILSNVSSTLYKSSLKRANHDDDDWGPVIERKEKYGKLE